LLSLQLIPLTKDSLTRSTLRISWRAKPISENPFAQMSVEEIQALLGTHIVPTPEVLSVFTTEQEEMLKDIPDNYRYSDKYSKCEHHIRDQGKCGSCWAFGAAGTLSSKYCGAGHDVILSEQNLVDCDRSLNMGCNGGYIFMVWRFLETTGITTEHCYPYKSGDGTDNYACKQRQADPKCEDNKPVPDKVYKCAGPSAHPTQFEKIKAEIYANGPTELAFTVYQDFMNYEDGVYVHTTGSQLGGHAVRLIGYGKENGLDYWLCANSWGARWGNQGLFKIAQGDCGSNGQIYSCAPDMSGLTSFESS